MAFEQQACSPQAAATAPPAERNFMAAVFGVGSFAVGDTYHRPGLPATPIQLDGAHAFRRGLIQSALADGRSGAGGNVGVSGALLSKQDAGQLAREKGNRQTVSVKSSFHPQFWRFVIALPLMPRGNPQSPCATGAQERSPASIPQTARGYH